MNGFADFAIIAWLNQWFAFAFFPVSNLCSHIYALCFMAHSLFNQNHELKAQPCTEACPHLKVFQITKDLLPQHRIWSHRSDNHSTIGSIDTVSLGMNIPKKYLHYLLSIKWIEESNFFGFFYCCMFQCTWFILLKFDRSTVLPVQPKSHWNEEMLQHKWISCQRWQTHRKIQIKQQHKFKQWHTLTRFVSNHPKHVI